MMQNLIRLSPNNKINIDTQDNNKDIDAGSWDQEIWAKENPIDYIKAVKLLNSFSSDVRLEIFNQIYKINFKFILTNCAI